MNAPEAQRHFDETDAPDAPPVRLFARVHSLAIKMAFPFIAEKDIRFYLCGVNLRPLAAGGVMVVATDGRRFLIVRDPNGYAESEVTAAVCKDAIKHASNGNTFDVMSNGTVYWNDKVTQPLFVQPGNSIIEGDFPRIENVVDTVGYREGISGAVNADYLADAVSVKTGATAPAIRFFSGGEDKPLLFAYGGIGELECFGGIMPMRDSLYWLPDWLPERGEFSLQRA